MTTLRPMTYAAAARHIASAPHVYALLGVHRDATLEERTAARRVLALAVHPDRNAGRADAEQLMARVNVAFNTLADKHLHTLYAAALAARLRECAACNGRGYSRKQKGFRSSITTVCPSCLGSGWCGSK